MSRIIIVGGPKTGKTTLADGIAKAFNSIPYATTITTSVCHTDDLMHLGWSESSQAAAAWLDEPGPWIIEGVAAVRALRKWRDQHPGDPPPVDRVILLTTPHVELNAGQRSMTKGHESIWREVEPWLAEHNMEIEYR